MQASIVIIDYGMGNLRSVQKAFEQVGAQACISSDPQVIAQAEKLVLPGVGAFRDAITKLRETGLDQVILEHIQLQAPFLGICLGMQLLFTRSHEDGLYAGLDIFAGEVLRFESLPAIKVPHMGWNTLEFSTECPLFKGLPENPSVYFVHSYYCQPVDERWIAARSHHPFPFAAALWRDNLFATQFHPEKSQAIGLQMLKNFAELPT
jgi:glutamine amidotransferase